MKRSPKRAQLAAPPGLPGPSPEARILPLVELVARASTEPSAWGEFVAVLSAELDDAAVILTLDLPNTRTTMLAYRIHTLPECTEVFARFAREETLPWPLADVSTEAFCDLAHLLPDSRLRETDFYRDYMAPQDFAPQAPLAHVFGSADGKPLAAVAIYRRVGKRPFFEADLRWLDLLVPHLGQTFRIHSMLLGRTRREDAYQEVMDRFPTGVVMIDKAGSVVATNRAAQRIAAQDDGLSLANGRIQATLASSDVVLQRAVRGVLEAPTETTLRPDQGFTLRRPSGMREFSVMVSYLLAPKEVSAMQNAVAVVYIADPEFQRLGLRAMLGSFHSLTAAELELAALICEGETLESAARARGVSRHTARSQLKRIFEKTETSRQADLVGLVTAGLTKLRRRTRKDPGDGA